MSDLAAKRCAARMRRHFGSDLPSHALVLGSGFESVVESMQVHGTLSYADLPGFPRTSVPGHAGRLLCAELSGLPILVCCGRAHYYEGATMARVMFPVRALAAAGVGKLLLTNAAGGINPRFRPGEFMLFADHINLTGVNPLRGLPASGGRCFVELSEAYSRALRKQLQTAARGQGIKLHEGVYLCVSGPSYETPAEIRAFRQLGADAVGMSTVPEVLMARYRGLEVAAFSCITNLAAGMAAGRLSHEEVLAVGRESARQAALLLAAAARALRESGAGRKNV